jgi:endonuclease I
VILIYSGESVNAAQEYNNANGWTREHVWAKSRGDFGTDKGAGTDCHHLKPCSSSLNSSRSNRAFGEGGSQIWYNGSATDNYSGVEYTFEPRDEVKGDVARMILYMATRYNGENGEPDLDLTEQVLGTTDKQPIHGMKSILLKWHNEDPVDDYERNRNNVVYFYQENRNPFIDHPEYVELIWGTQTGIGFQSKETGNFTYTVNDGLISLKSDNPFDKVEVFNLVGQKVGVYNGHNSKAMEINTTASGLLILLIDGKQTIKIIK